jgi:DNA segregation ATPase FtsK/SpoIIIE, S-DNA-T family
MAKNGKSSHIPKKEIIAVILFFSSIFLLFSIVAPVYSGVVGQFLYKNFMNLFGYASYSIPIVFLIGSWRLFVEEDTNWVYKFVGVTIFLLSSSSLFSLISKSFSRPEMGGLIGGFISGVLLKLFGSLGAYIVNSLLITVSLVMLINFSMTSFVDALKKMFMGLVAMFKESLEELKDSFEEDEEVKSKKKNRELAKEFVKPNIVKALDKKLDEKKEEIKKEEKPNPIKITYPKEKEVIHEKEEEKEIKVVSPQEYILPSPSLLKKPVNTGIKVSDAELEENARILQHALQSFDVDAKVVNIQPGPVITRYEIELSPGVKVNAITSLSNDICLAMKAQSVRILAPIPGKSAVGVEVPNSHTQPVLFREMVESMEYKNSNSKLSFAIGKSVSGETCVADIGAMPHLLVAGATGSGKSVCVNTLIMSILYKAKPNEVKFILVDPKMVELSYYKDMPHLYNPVITNPREASKTLQGIVALMEKRYKRFAEEGVRNIESYNKKMEVSKGEKEFYLVVIIDELADLMLVASRDVEESIVRLTQKARAVGIHVVLATQRPSVDVITGIIKANLPSRIAFQVLSKTDSRVIIDSNGAEDLIGKGDMLYLGNGAAKPSRIQGAYLSEKEVQNVLDFIKAQGSPDYSSAKAELVVKNIDEDEKDQKSNEQFRRALELVVERKKISYDLLRANGFSGPKATDIISVMEMKGFIQKPGGSNKWEIYYDAISEYMGSGDNA